MAGVVSYKQYNKRDRRAVLETDFSKGMMSTDGLIDEGYVRSLVNFTFEKETGSIIPRPGLGVSSLIFLDSEDIEDNPFFSDDVSIKAAKECVENGVVYNQNILGKMDDDSTTKGDIWLCTSLSEKDPTSITFSEECSDTVSFSDTVEVPDKHKAYFFIAGDSSIHKVPLSDDILRRIETPIGSFAFGNSFYFFGEDSEGSPGLFHTVFRNDHYVFEPVVPKDISVSEAVTYGYNMLLEEPYTFINKHSSPQMQFEGILPYEVDSTHSHTKLLMTPKQNQPIDLVCYYDAPNKKYDIIWEWREVTASDWTEIQRETITFNTDTVLKVDYFQPPAKAIMIRISAYPYESLEGQGIEAVSDIIEKAMVVGFDFTVENYGTNTAVEQKNYDLTTATGMASWNGRVVVWGVLEDPTILFISDYNEPAYFPYPNNITVFDEPIIHAEEFMDSLVVFTTNKLYQVSLADDGNSWKITVLQSHLNIKPWDRHLIQTVRNMLYFKSGNYYYMMVPKAQSLTGELTLAPITTPITSFFDHFSVNVEEILRNTYGYLGEYELLTYYNYLDYDDVHNVYVYSFDDSTNVFHFDIIYSTVDRTWKIWIYESTNILFPYRHDATQMGNLATTSTINVLDVADDYSRSKKRVIQIFKWDKLSMTEYYLPTTVEVNYAPDEFFPTIDDSDYSLVVHSANTSFDDVSFAAVVKYPTYYFEDTALYFQDPSSLFAGLNKRDIVLILKDVFVRFEYYYSFRNCQFVDTGYRNDELQYKKRYRELQLQVNNLDKQKLSFGMEFILDGAPRKLLYKYDTLQTIDEFNDDYGVVYVDTVPYLEVAPDEIDLSNQWTIDQGLNPEVSLWNVRISISGKGSAPRFKLYSRNNKRFELLGINWISKIMHMR